mmetsp:Transcript_14044/g.39777  ORF Transcript_14044/g.39777 Transcript_14044/m.39777 type:complete len:83 (-) Transcript_14044:150-398(-)
MGAGGGDPQPPEKYGWEAASPPALLDATAPTTKSSALAVAAEIPLGDTGALYTPRSETGDAMGMANRALSQAEPAGLSMIKA